MQDFNNEYTFWIRKEKKEDGKTFSREAYDEFLKAIGLWIGQNVFDHWATQELKVIIKLEGKYEPKGDGDGKEIPVQDL